jgi:fatty-acyl-CoA synthase
MPTEPYIATVLRVLEERRGEVAFVWRDTPHRASDFLALIYRYARALDANGIVRGQLVALLAPNAPEAIAIRYAANLLGAATTFLSSPPSPETRQKLIEDIAPDLVVVFPETVGLVPDGVVARIVGAGDCGVTIARIDEEAKRQSSEPVTSLAWPDELAVIASSGGSTGIPKGSCRDFTSYTWLASGGVRTGRRQLVNGPLAYLSQVLVDQTLLGGGLVVLRDGFDPVDTLAQIQRHGITDLFLVEPQLFELMDHPDLGGADIRSLKRLTHIGASAPPVLRHRALDHLGPILVHTYGASEEGIVSLLQAGELDPNDEAAFSSAGRVLPGVEVRLRREDGTLAASGEPGLIESRSPGTAQGYRNRPDLTRRAFVEGWYHSGDIGRFDDEGRLHVIGRADDIVREGSELISPTRIEDILCGLPSVRCAVVIRDQVSESWIALAQPWGRGTSIGDCGLCLKLALGERVAAKIRVIPVDNIPLTSQGKPDRETIVRIAASQFDPMISTPQAIA